MCWVIGKFEKEPVRSERLQLPAFDYPGADGQTFNWSVESKAWLRQTRRENPKRERIREYLTACEMPCTLESVAQATGENCKRVREVVQELKNCSTLVESTNGHVLMRVER